MSLQFLHSHWYGLRVILVLLAHSSRRCWSTYMPKHSFLTPTSKRYWCTYMPRRVSLLCFEVAPPPSPPKGSSLGVVRESFWECFGSHFGSVLGVIWQSFWEGSEKSRSARGAREALREVLPSTVLLKSSPGEVEVVVTEVKLPTVKPSTWLVMI